MTNEVCEVATGVSHMHGKEGARYENDEDGKGLTLVLKKIKEFSAKHGDAEKLEEELSLIFHRIVSYCGTAKPCQSIFRRKIGLVEIKFAQTFDGVGVTVREPGSEKHEIFPRWFTVCKINEHFLKLFEH